MNLSVTHVLHSESQSVQPSVLDKQLQTFWELKALGIHDKEKTLYDDFGRRLLNLPDHLSYVCDPEDEDFEVNASQLTKRMKHFASVLNHFWRQWRSEYE